MPKQPPPWCLRVSILAASLLVIATALRWSLVDVLTPFLMYPLLGALWLGLAGCLIWSVVHLIKRHAFGWQARMPLLVCLASALIAALVPFTDLWLRANFYLLSERRKEVVDQIRAGKLEPNVEHNASLIALPDSSPTLSMGGNEVVIEEHRGQLYVFFFTYRGILDSYSGFLFVPEGGDPREFSDLSEAESTQIVPFGGPWYFAAHR